MALDASDKLLSEALAGGTAVGGAWLAIKRVLNWYGDSEPEKKHTVKTQIEKLAIAIKDLSDKLTTHSLTDVGNFEKLAGQLETLSTKMETFIEGLSRWQDIIERSALTASQQATIAGAKMETFIEGLSRWQDIIERSITKEKK